MRVPSGNGACVLGPPASVLTVRASLERVVAQSMFCDRETGLPTALRFTSLADYELRKAICAAVASIRDASGVTPLEVRHTLGRGSCKRWRGVLNTVCRWPHRCSSFVSTCFKATTTPATRLTTLHW